MADRVAQARTALIERVKEFVDVFGRGPKAGQPDYGRWILLENIEPLRVALDEYERFREMKSERKRKATARRRKLRRREDWH